MTGHYRVWIDAQHWEWSWNDQQIPSDEINAAVEKARLSHIG